MTQRLDRLRMSPFFQLYAWQTCHASTSTVGLIFGAMPTACFIGSFHKFVCAFISKPQGLQSWIESY